MENSLGQAPRPELTGPNSEPGSLMPHYSPAPEHDWDKHEQEVRETENTFTGTIPREFREGPVPGTSSDKELTQTTPPSTDVVLADLKEFVDKNRSNEQENNTFSQQEPPQTVADTTAPLATPTKKGLFSSLFGKKKVEQQPQQERVATPEEQIKAGKALASVTQATEKRREALKENHKEGPVRALLSSLEKVGDYWNTKVGKKYKLGASLGILAAGALSAYAAPAIVTTVAIGAGAASLRALTAAGTYAGVKKLLNSKYEAWQQSDSIKDKIKIAGTETAIIAGAAFGGWALTELVGHMFGAEAIPSSTDGITPPLPETAEVPIETPSNEAIFPVEETASIENTQITGVTTSEVPSIDTAPQTPITETASIPPSPSPEVSASAPVTPSPIETSTTQSVPIPDQTTSSPAPQTLEASVALPYSVKGGDTMWGIIRTQLETNPAFQELGQAAKNTKIANILAKVAEDPSSYGIKSGDINIIRTGDSISISKLIAS